MFFWEKDLFGREWLRNVGEGTRMMRLCIRKSRKSTNFIKLAVILYREGIVAYAIPVAKSHHMYAATSV